MSYTKNFKFTNPIHPGETLSELLEEKFMTQKELSERLGVTEKHISGIIKGKNNISPDLALKLESIFKLSASFWNNLQTSYNEDISRIQEEESLRNEKSLTTVYGYNFLKKLGFVKEATNPLEKVKFMRNFFGVASLFHIPKISNSAFAFRKTEKNELKHELFASWLRIGEKIGEKIEVQDFSKSKLRNILTELKNFTKEEKIDIKKIEKLFAEAGIRFVFVESFSGVPVIGLTRKFKGSPLIQISGRGQKMDIFWFTLFHEIGHLLEHYSPENHIFIDYETPESNKMEKEADEFAGNFLINREIYDEEFGKLSINIEKIAKESNTSLSIVAGRVCHDLKDSHPNIWKEASNIRQKLVLQNLQY